MRKELTENELVQMYANKANFVEELKNFVRECADNRLGIEDMHYVYTKDGREYVYVEYADNAQQRFCVDCDNKDGILADFVLYMNNHDKYGWLPKEERV